MRVLDISKHRIPAIKPYISLYPLKYEDGRMSNGRYLHVHFQNEVKNNPLKVLKLKDKLIMITRHSSGKFYNVYKNGEVVKLTERGVHVKFQEIQHDIDETTIRKITRKYKLIELGI